MNASGTYPHIPKVSQMRGCTTDRGSGSTDGSRHDPMCVSEPGTGTWFALPLYHQSSWPLIEAFVDLHPTCTSSPPARRHAMLAASLTVVNRVAGCDGKGVWFICVALNRVQSWRQPPV